MPGRTKDKYGIYGCILRLDVQDATKQNSLICYKIKNFGVEKSAMA